MEAPLDSTGPPNQSNMVTWLLLVCSLLPLADSVSISASSDIQFFHATLDWATGSLEGVQYQPRQIKVASVNAPCFFLCTGAKGPYADTGSTLMCRDKSQAFSAVCSLNSTQDPDQAWLDPSGGQMLAVAEEPAPVPHRSTNHTVAPTAMIYSINLTTSTSSGRY